MSYTAIHYIPFVTMVLRNKEIFSLDFCIPGLPVCRHSYKVVKIEVNIFFREK